MKVNPDKCHLLIDESCKREINIAGNIIENSKCERILTITIDSNFDLRDMWKNYARKLV